MAVFSFKAPRPLMQRVRSQLERFVHTRREAPLTEGEFIRRAIEHELDHLHRSRTKRRRRRAGNARWNGNAVDDSGISGASA